jgi:choline-sulfatase
MPLNRRAFLNAAGGASVALAAPPGQPNVLFIMTDQQFAEAMSCRIGARYLRTPHMDGLAANGMLFSRAYCPNPLCVPSRASIFTGRYPTETGVQTNDRVKDFLDSEKFPNLGSIFKRAGYATGFFGKWHMPFPANKAATHGFDIVTPNRKQGADAGTAAGASDFIRANRGRPFLVVASFLNPHNICQWPRGEEFSEGDPGTPPPLNQCPPRRANYGTPRNETDTMLLMRRSFQATPMFPVGNFDESKWRQYIWAYYRMIEKVDALIGKVLQSVRDAGADRRTVIVFTADHGDCQGAHGWNQKTVFYEESARVPFIVSCPGTTKRGVSNRLVHTGVDLIPTLCGYAGIPVPRGLPGLALHDTANGRDDRDPREYVVVCNRMIQGAEIDGRLPTPDGRMVRSQRFKYCAYSEGARRESLVDLDRDPGEMVNLAGDPRHQKTLDRHRAMLAAWGRQTGDRFAVPAS